MFISVLELFKIGIGPSSSHTIGPMVAANDFINRTKSYLINRMQLQFKVKCYLKGSLAYTGKGHATDKAVMLGLHGFSAKSLASHDVDLLVQDLQHHTCINLPEGSKVDFSFQNDIVFDKGQTLAEHPNGIVFELLNHLDEVVLTETYFSIGGGFINTIDEIHHLVAPIKLTHSNCKYPFDSASLMLEMAEENQLSIAKMKRANELAHYVLDDLNAGLDNIWQAMSDCVKNGLTAEGIMPGGLDLPRRAQNLYQRLLNTSDDVSLNDWLCAYAMAVNEENAAGHLVVTAPTNGAAGVIPAVIYYFVKHEQGNQQQVRDFLLTAAAIGGLIKHRSSISGAEVGCQGEVGAASAMAAAGLCAVKGGSVRQVENSAEIALEHHLGMTCDPVNGLVQIPCIERNGFGAIKAYSAASLALKGSGKHFVSLDNCITAMRQTGLEMSEKFKETALGGLAISITEC